MKRLLFLILLNCSLICSCSHTEINSGNTIDNKSESDKSIDLILGRIVEGKIQEAINDTLYSDKEVTKWLKSINEDGSWNDINYKSQEPAVWEPRFHLDRIIILSVSFLNERSTYHKNKEIKETILKAINFWLNEQAKSVNWWWSVIGEPQRDGLILLLLNKSGIEPDDSLCRGLISRFSNQDPFTYTGANRSDVGIALLYKELFEKNDKGVNRAIEAIFSSVEYGEGTSFQKDGCYFENTSQLYIGGYSEVLLNNILQFADYVNGTKYCLGQYKLNIISSYIRGVYSHSIRGQVMAFNCHGRSVSDQGRLNKEWSSKWISRLSRIDKENKTVYDDIISRLSGREAPSYGLDDFSNHYYIGDFTVHSNSRYNVSIRTLSLRTRRDEFDNGENSKGYFIGDGSTCIMCSGSEYYDIMPLWDWLYVPGTTAPQMESIPLPYYSQMGVSEFCGGVSHHGCSVVAFDYFDPYKSINTGGRKGYFMFKELMVCLGTKLESDKPFHTTINQCWASPDNTIISLKGSPPINTSIEEIDKCYNGTLEWLIHDGIGYWIPGEQDVMLRIGPREGRWYDINQGRGTTDIVKGKVFQLSIEHANNKNYQYVVYPKATINDLEGLVNQKNIGILYNSDMVQAVYDKLRKILEVIFYEPGEISIEGGSLAVSKPCVMLIEIAEGDNLRFYIADPSQKLSDLKVIFKTQDHQTEKVIYFPEDSRGKSIESSLQIGY